VASAEGVVLAFGAAREAGDAATLAQTGHRSAATGKDLVRIGLVSDVPDDAIARRVEDVVQGDGQFHRPQIRSQVAAGAGDGLHQKVSQFFRYLRQFG
jgi:hypothetical protein